MKQKKIKCATKWEEKWQNEIKQKSTKLKEDATRNNVKVGDNNRIKWRGTMREIWHKQDPKNQNKTKTKYMLKKVFKKKQIEESGNKPD